MEEKIISDTTETRWFKIISFIVLGFIVGVSIANIVYFNRIRTGTCNAVTQGEANIMMWVNIVISIITGLLFIWSLWRLLFSKELRHNIGEGASSYFKGESTGLVTSKRLKKFHKKVQGKPKALEEYSKND